MTNESIIKGLHKFDSTPLYSVIEVHTAMHLAMADERDNKDNYWQERCTLAEKCLQESPCDPDITCEQIVAHSEYNQFLKNAPTPPKQ